MIPYFDLTSAHAPLDDSFDAVWEELKATGRFIGGHHVESFERRWASYCGTHHCVGLSNGTDALRLSLRALGIGAGDEVILPTNTFIATAAAVVDVQATPIFVDVDPRTLLMTADGISAAITPATAAIIVVHLFGHPVDMDAILNVAKINAIPIIEDAAQAHGAMWRERRVGSIGNVGCFSFYPAKNLGAFGDAGAVVTNDWEIAEQVRIMSNHGRSTHSDADHVLVGGNHRLDALQAAILNIKISALDEWNHQRRRIYNHYRARLAELPLTLIDNPTSQAINVHHLVVVRSSHRAELIDRLKSAGVGVGIHYPVPCHRQSAFATWSRGSLPTAERAANEIFSLPIYPGLENDKVDYVCDVLIEAFASLQPVRELPPPSSTTDSRTLGCSHQ